jgi:hypothetical protein
VGYYVHTFSSSDLLLVRLFQLLAHASVLKCTTVLTYQTSLGVSLDTHQVHNCSNIKVLAQVLLDESKYGFSTRYVAIHRKDNNAFLVCVNHGQMICVIPHSMINYILLIRTFLVVQCISVRLWSNDLLFAKLK